MGALIVVLLEQIEDEGGCVDSSIIRTDRG